MNFVQFTSNRGEVIHDALQLRLKFMHRSLERGCVEDQPQHASNPGRLSPATHCG
jgi:hypothetical protein